MKFKDITSKYFALAILACVFILQIIYSFPSDRLYLSLSIILLGQEIFQSRLFYRKMTGKSTIQVKSLTWLASLFTTILLCYWFSKGIPGTNAWVAISLILTYQLLFTIRNYRTVYVIDDTRIYGINDDSIRIYKSDISDLRITENMISIDTDNYQNELEFHRSKMIKPSWNQATLLLKSLLKPYGG